MRGCFAVLTAAAAAMPAVADAQPATHPPQASCRVHITDAPPDARAEIEAWVRAEPRCERELDVRVVSTDDGLVLSARDGEGRVRERIVPDAQAAAVLVVSWMADDSLGPDTPSPALRAVPAASAAAASAPALTAAPPSSTEPTWRGTRAHKTDAGDDELPDELRTRGPDMGVPRRRFGRSLALGATASEHGHLGVRGQLDLFHAHHLSFGIAAGWRQIGNHAAGFDGSGAASSDPDEGVGQLRLLVGTEHSFGWLTLSAQLGVGADLVTGDNHSFDQMQMTGDVMPLAPMAPTVPTADGHDETKRVIPAAELGLLGRVRITDTWGLLGGPLLQTGSIRPEPQLSVFVGVVRRL